jgi:flavin-dependent dehydrogenase
VSVPKPLDVLVGGGGPAGSAAAIRLAAAGLSVLVLERSWYDRSRIGETLPPAAKALLRALGFWDRFCRAGHLRSPGVVSCWGGEGPSENDFVFNPYGEGWHLDRCGFDADLAAAAAEQGADVRLGTGVRACRRVAPGRWQVSAHGPGGTVHLEASFLIDAAGRASWPGRPAPRRRVYDRLVALAGFVHHAGTPGGVDRRTWVEAAPEGWWYSAALPGDRLVAAYLTDSDLLEGDPRRWEARWEDLLQAAPHTRQRLGLAHPAQGIQVVPANTSLATAAGDGWLAAGEAACTLDPLSSQGISWALRSGLEAADALLASDRSAALGRYASGTSHRFANYLQVRAVYYSRERRWPGSPFWRRRVSPFPDAPASLPGLPGSFLRAPWHPKDVGDDVIVSNATARGVWLLSA